MLILYIKSGCPFCNRVLEYAEDNNIIIDERDVYDSEAAMAELMEKGGKRQIPFLHDTDKEVIMYESADIIEYFKSMGGGEAKQDENPGVCIPS